MRGQVFTWLLESLSHTATNRFISRRSSPCEWLDASSASLMQPRTEAFGALNSALANCANPFYNVCLTMGGVTSRFLGQG
jgi:hypothetical protein